MKQPEKILSPVGIIRGGAELPHLKDTAELESIIMPPPATVKLALKQHIGVPCEPIVNVGDKVFVGTKIADSENNFSSPIHSSVSGTVTAISADSITIESDGEMKPEPSLAPPVINNADDLVKATRDCGLVGLGGAGFPVHIKLAPATSEAIDTLIINGAECEPYITSDYRTCMEDFDAIIGGVYLLKDIFKFKKIIIAIEGNKPKAIEKLYQIATDKQDADDTVKLMRLHTSYPQGAEKMLVYTTTKRKIPMGKLPADVGCVVMNITTVATLYNFVKTGMPLTKKRITFEGTAAIQPKNIIVPIGTSIADVIEFCGGASENAEKVLYGGTMMGIAVKDTQSPILKQNNAILVMEPDNKLKSTPCIRCGRCANTCPMKLAPAKIEASLNTNNFEALSGLNVNYCIECGSCSFVCPARRPLTQSMRTAKSILRRNNNAK